MARTIFLRVSPLQIVVMGLVVLLSFYFLVPPMFRALLGGGDGRSKTLKVVREKAVSWDKEGKSFRIGGKRTLIISGALHYFRVPPVYWEDRLAKMAAAGLNTVETYMPWNLHEPVPGAFDFTGRLDVHRFVRLAQKHHLHVILRPGPYICSEWDFGGLPAWLLYDSQMAVRSMYGPYLHAVREYMVKVAQAVGDLQYVYGGPIIAVQLENEYGAYQDGSTEDSRGYMKFLYDLFKEVGFKELLFTSDGQHSLENALKLRPHPDVLLTVNFMHDTNGLDMLEELQPNKPKMVMEFWSGWFDHWGEEHVPRKHTVAEIGSETANLLRRGISINYYMFHGGTNFGFMNGANWGPGKSYQPTITSYDYDAPLSENGDTTEKYNVIRDAIAKYKGDSLPLPPIPPPIPSYGYGEVKLTLYLSILSTLQYLPEPYVSQNPVAMEMLPLHGSGQGYGFILYRATIPTGSKSVQVQLLKDYGIAMIESVPVETLSSFASYSFLISPSINIQSEGKEGIQLDLLVENAGRVNYGYPLEDRKGILGNVKVDGHDIVNWKIYSLEFEPDFVEKVSEGGMWQRTPPSMPMPGPALFKGSFNIQGVPKDTFLYMQGWSKGVVFVNGANLGRYWNKGPQGTLYVPGPVLRRGVNQVVVFETRMPRKPQTVSFKGRPILDISSSPDKHHPVIDAPRNIAANM